MRRGERKLKKGGAPRFPSELENHRRRSSAAQQRNLRGGYSSAYANLIVRQSSYCLPSGIRCNRPHAGQVRYVTSCRKLLSQEASPCVASSKIFSACIRALSNRPSVSLSYNAHRNNRCFPPLGKLDMPNLVRR